MKVTMFSVLSMIHTALAGPAKRDCGETRSFTTTNSCGITYGGGWVECEMGFTALPTFTIPSCDEEPTPLLPAERVAVETITTAIEIEIQVPTTTASPDALITPGPWTNTSASYIGEGNSTASICSPLWICIDAITVCGPVTQMYGNCHDTCTPAPLVPPICTLPPVTEAPAYDRAHPKMNFDKMQTAPERIHLAQCDIPGQEWRCAPKGW